MDFNIKQFLEEKQIKLAPPAQTLFEPNWEALKVDRCPWCSNRLKFMRKEPTAYCDCKKHRRTYRISFKRLEEVKKTWA